MSKRFTRIIAMLMTLVLAVGMIPSFGIAAGAESGVNLDYSKGDSIYNESFSPEQVVNIICGSECSQAEETYLATIASYFFKYTPVLDNSCITITGLGDTLTVKASKVSYTANNGVTVNWIPSKAVCKDNGELELTEADSVWTCKFTGLKEAELYEVSVTYKTEFVISAADADAVANRAYSDAVDAIEAEEKYNIDIEAYNSAKNAYDKYREAMKQYDLDLTAYNNYKTKYNAYLLKLDAYNQYLKDLEKYEEDKKLYDNYETDLAAYNKAVQDYNDEVEAIKPQVDAYNQYLKDLEAYNTECAAITKRLEVLESCYISGSNGEQMYATIKGGTVQSVMSHKDEMVNAYGGEGTEGGQKIATAVSNCGDATDALIALLDGYNALRSKNASDEEKFNWYLTNYTALRDNFNKLYEGLYFLFPQGAVQAGLYSGTGSGDTKNRMLRFCEFLAHLYVISTCLDDTVLANNDSFSLSGKFIRNSYKAAGKTGLTGDNVYCMLDFFADNPELKLTDTNKSSPAGITWPEAPTVVEKPEIQTVVPEKPVKIDEPLKPDTVEEPVKPEGEVSEPVKPETVAAPGAMPEAPVFSSVMRSLMTAVEGETLKQRTVSADVKIEKTCEITKVISAGDVEAYPVITFKDYDGSVLKYIQVKTGKIEDTDIPTPNIPANNEKKNYTFNGWKDSAGKAYNFSDIKADATLYPDVTESDVKYKITWVTGAGKKTVEYKYGETPAYTGKTTKASTAKYTYTFKGWDKEIVPVTADATYTAEYTSEIRTYTVKWVLKDKTYEQIYEYGETPKCPVDPLTEAVQSSNTEYYGFTGWDTAPVKVSKDAVYTAVYSSSWIMPATVDGKTVGLEVKTGGTSISAEIPDNATDVDLSYVASKAAEAGLNIVLAKGGTVVTIPEKVVSEMPYSNGLKVSVENTEVKGAEKAVSVKITTASGETVSPAGVRVTLDVQAFGDYKALAEEGENWTESDIYAEATGKTIVLSDKTETVAIVKMYTITVESATGGSVTVSAETASEGQTVTLTVVPEEGYNTEDGKGKITLKDGTVVDLGSNMSFEMPASDITVSYEFGRTEYTVKFIVDGNVYSEKTYYSGDTLELPADPEKAYTEDEGYVFEGWEPAVEEKVTKDAEYTAKFTASPLKKNEDVEFIIPSWLYAVAAVMVVGIAAAVTLGIVKKQKKNAK